MTELKFRPVGDKILIKRAKEEEKKQGNIILAASGSEAFHKGEVLAVGHGIYTSNGTIPFSVCVGDKILYTAYAGILIEDDTYLLQDHDVLGVEE